MHSMSVFQSARHLAKKVVRRINAARTVNFGSLRELRPVSPNWGHDRGQPIGRYYLEKFLTKHMQDICGRVLEFGDATYTKRFGGHRVTQGDVMNIDPSFPSSTFVGDLAEADNILPSAAFDCVIFTQC